MLRFSKHRCKMLYRKENKQKQVKGHIKISKSRLDKQLQVKSGQLSAKSAFLRRDLKDDTDLDGLVSLCRSFQSFSL